MSYWPKKSLLTFFMSSQAVVIMAITNSVVQLKYIRLWSWHCNNHEELCSKVTIWDLIFLQILLVIDIKLSKPWSLEPILTPFNFIKLLLGLWLNLKLFTFHWWKSFADIKQRVFHCTDFFQSMVNFINMLTNSFYMHTCSAAQHFLLHIQFFLTLSVNPNSI